MDKVEKLKRAIWEELPDDEKYEFVPSQLKVGHLDLNEGWCLQYLRKHRQAWDWYCRHDNPSVVLHETIFSKEDLLFSLLKVVWKVLRGETK